MTMHTGGWLELRLPDWDGPRPTDLMAHGPAWEAIFYVEPFITLEYDELATRVASEHVAEVMRTGLPPDVSARTEADYEADVSAWAGVALPEWADWGSIAQVDWQEPDGSGWRLVMQTGTKLAQRYGEGNVRLVLWGKVVM